MHVRVHAFQLNSLLLPHGTLSHAHMRTLPHSPPSPHKSSHCTQPLGTCIWLTKRARLCAVQDQHDLQDARACVLCWASMTHKTRVPVCCAGPAVGITRWPLRFAEWGLGTGRTGGVLAWECGAGHTPLCAPSNKWWASVAVCCTCRAWNSFLACFHHFDRTGRPVHAPHSLPLTPLSHLGKVVPSSSCQTQHTFISIQCQTRVTLMRYTPKHLHLQSRVCSHACICVLARV